MNYMRPASRLGHAVDPSIIINNELFDSFYLLLSTLCILFAACPFLLLGCAGYRNQKCPVEVPAADLK